jgi:hypothetical protein
MNDGGFIPGVFIGAVVAALTCTLIGGCRIDEIKMEAIREGHAKYVLTEPNKSEATFTWNTNCGVAK